MGKAVERGERPGGTVELESGRSLAHFTGG